MSVFIREMEKSSQAKRDFGCVLFLRLSIRDYKRFLR